MSVGTEKLFNKTKSAKAIQDAHNYLDMLTAKTA
jgi:hypothetical protein